jgi:hypothetical protein
MNVKDVLLASVLAGGSGGGSGGGGGSGAAENVVPMSVGGTELQTYLEIGKTVGEIAELMRRYGAVYAMLSSEVEGVNTFNTAIIVSVGTANVMAITDLEEGGTAEVITLNASSRNENPRYYLYGA